MKTRLFAFGMLLLAFAAFVFLPAPSTLVRAQINNPTNAGTSNTFTSTGTVVNTSNGPCTGPTNGIFFPGGSGNDINIESISGNQLGLCAHAAQPVVITNTAGVVASAYFTTSNCASSSGTCTAASTGSVSIAAAATTVTVSTTAVSANSNIMVTEDASLGTKLGVTCNTTTGRTYAVTARTAGTSFVITTNTTPATNPACLGYLIID